jgi:ribonucleoside-diphosphate reductase alpha chain
MRIKKRDGRFEQLSFDKVIFRLRKLCNDPNLSPLQKVDPDIVAQQVVSRIYDGVTSCELDEEAARIAVNITDNMEYHSLASRITISNMHKSTNEKFSHVMEMLYNNKDTNGTHAPILADDIIDIIRKHKDVLDNVIKYERDYLFDYFGFKTLEKSYLQKIMDHNTNQMRVVERPQHLYMRVAVGIHKDDIASAIKTYDFISQHFYTHASPTLFNSGTRLANLSSCFHEDTIVATVNRGPVKIKDVQIGDQVVTHKGNVKKVAQLHKNPLNNRKFYELNIAKTAPAKVTDNHKVWAVKVKKNKQGKKHSDKRQMYDIEFVREYLAKDNCQLLSSEYKNIKTKLNFICFCGREANASFESIYYGDIRCNSRECIFKRKSKFCKQKTYSDPQWISVEELEKGDYVCIPNKIVDCKNEYVIDLQDFDTNIKNDKQVEYEYDVEYTETCATVSTTYVVPTYSYQQTRKHQEVNRKWVITSDVAKFIGVFYGDGHIMKAIGKDGKERIRGIGITIHSKNVDLINFCVRTGEQLFGIKACIHKMHNQNVVQVLFNSMIIGFVFKQLFGVYFDGKKIWSDMFQWNKLLVHSLLEGIVTTDGCVTKDGTVMIQMSNVQFMRDLYYLLRNNNIDVSYGNPQRQHNGTADHVNINIPAKYINFNNINKIYSDDRLKNTSINKCRNQYSSITVNDFTFLPVRSKKELLDDLPDYVYTLGIEDDHSYNVEGIVAQNCFLLGTEDSLEGIFKTFTDCGKISKVGGGIGVHISNIRAKGSIIRGTNGVSDGIVPMLKVYNQVSTYINQSGRRKGSFAMYIEPWHADIMEFLDMRKNQGHEELRARDLFYALWTPDLFMKQVEKNGDWYLMCPDECPGLNDTYGEEFEKLYWSYVEQKKYKRVVKAQDVWTKILDSQIETGVPYIGYKDAVNKKCNQKALGTIKSSNLCVAPETMILTSKGYFPISKLEDQDIEVWNGQEFSKTTIRKTGENQELLKVSLSNGSTLECTPYHKFYVVTGKRPSNYPRIKQIQANELIEGMKLIKCDYPIITDGLDNFPYPYEHGLFCADGTLEHNVDVNQSNGDKLCGDKACEGLSYCNRHMHMYTTDSQDAASPYCCAPIKPLPRITLYGEKKKLSSILHTRVPICQEDKNGRVNCRLPTTIYDKFIVPINYNLDIKLRWLEGLCDGDGTVTKSDKLTGIQISSIHCDFLDKVKYLLQTIGCDPKIQLAATSALRELPNGKGGKDLYQCQDLYRLMITSYDTARLCELGFRPKRLQLSGVYPKNNTKRWIQVNSIEHTQRYSDTYCFTEEKRGMGIFNGILTGQCIEISLYSDNQEYAVCNLASIALPKFVEYKDDGTPFFNFEKLKEVAEYTVHPMNKVIDHNYYPTPETQKSNMAHRPLGIGAQGLADVYFKMKLPFESKEAAQLNKEIFETIYYGTLRGSIELAKLDGKYASFDGSPFSEGKLQFDLAAEFDGINLDDYLSGRWDWDGLRKDLKKYGARNSMLIALMPTASSAQIMGNTESFEPIDSCIFKRRVLSGEYMVVNKYLVKDLEQLGLWNKEMKDLIIAHDGSIQNIPSIPDYIKRVYKTVWELSMKSVIEQCRDRGVFVDQMQSMNLFMGNPNYKKLTSMHFYAWKNNLKSGMYYLRSRNSASAGKFSIDANLEKQIREKQEAGKQLTQKEEQLICSIDNKEECMMCSS